MGRNTSSRHNHEEALPDILVPAGSDHGLGGAVEQCGPAAEDGHQALRRSERNHIRVHARNRARARYLHRLANRVWPADSTQSMVRRGPLLLQSLVVRVYGSRSWQLLGAGKLFRAPDQRWVHSVQEFLLQAVHLRGIRESLQHEDHRRGRRRTHASNSGPKTWISRSIRPSSVSEPTSTSRCSTWTSTTPSASTARRRPRSGPATTRFSSTWRTCSSVAR